MAELDLTTRRIIASNNALASLFGETAASLVGQKLDRFLPKAELRIAQRHFGDVAARRLEGYQATRHFKLADGHLSLMRVWVRRLELGELSDVAAVVLVGEHEAGGLLPLSLSYEVDAPPFALVVTDHDWRVEHCSTDIKALLGYDEAGFLGTALLGLVSPADAPGFLLAVTRAATSRRTTIVRVRLRGGVDREWRDVCCYVTPLCAHNPPRLGVMLTTPASVPSSTGRPRSADLEQHLWRIGLEVQAAGVLPEVPRTLAAQLSREFAGLSSRQWEIVTRLLLGERVPDIAGTMFLSPSTVRNHLTAIFRKFGVHSQSALLAKLKEASLPPGEAPGSRAEAELGEVSSTA